MKSRMEFAFDCLIADYATTAHPNPLGAFYDIEGHQLRLMVFGAVNHSISDYKRKHRVGS